jgi:anthranilate phosphoribosyltransferase
MLEALGIRLDLAPAQVAEVFKRVGITFFFAPVFHPAMRFVAPVRKQLGVPTTFNFLGPLANPAQPIATALGVANPVIAPKMAEELAHRGRSGLVFRSSDGLDELSTTSASSLWIVRDGEVEETSFDPTEFGISRAQISQLVGGDAKHNAEVARRLFAGETLENSQAIFDVVTINAAGGLVAYEIAKGSDMNIADLFSRSIQIARQAIESGAAQRKLVEWSAATQQF